MPASSPCIRLCVIEETSGLCRGCGRSVAEIAAWAALGEPQRLAVMATLQRRLQKLSQDIDRLASTARPGAR